MGNGAIIAPKPLPVIRKKDLQELAKLYSIQLSYEDAAGKTQRASRDALHAVLETRTGKLGSDTLAARRAELAARVVEPVTVIWQGTRPSVGVNADDGLVEYELLLESGDRYAGRLVNTRGAVEIPHRLPAGYHRLLLAGKHETMLFVAPARLERSEAEKTWGVFVPLYAAHTRGSWGVGDVRDLQAYRSWINELGGGIVATLPMLSAAGDEPSPYSPSSRLFWNELYLDLESLPEFEPADRDENELARVRNAAEIDYARVASIKRRALLRMAARFTPDDEFERFVPHAADYAEFRAHHDRAHNEGSQFAGTHAYHLYVQYRIAQQMRTAADAARSRGRGLYLDLPLGVHPSGYDAWRYREHFAPGVSVGAPPDLFFTKGQNWGFAPPDPDAARARHYDYFRACVRHHAEHAGILRIDHVMGLHRLFWIPEGAEAKDGVYLRYRDEELYAILLIEASRTGTTIVGEDLGTVPEYVPRAMERHGFRRMYVVQYEAKPERDAPAGLPPHAAVASVNTHDMPTFAGFWGGRDIEDRRAQGLLDAPGERSESDARNATRDALVRFLRARDLLQNRSGDTVAVLQGVLGFLAESGAEIVLVNLEDLWLETEPQNVPGVPDRSWKRRLRMSLEQARDDGNVKRLLRIVDDKRRGTDGDTRQKEGLHGRAGASGGVFAGKRDAEARNDLGEDDVRAEEARGSQR